MSSLSTFTRRTAEDATKLYFEPAYRLFVASKNAAVDQFLARPLNLYSAWIALRYQRVGRRKDIANLGVQYFLLGKTFEKRGRVMGAVAAYHLAIREYQDQALAYPPHALKYYIDGLIWQLKGRLDIANDFFERADQLEAQYNS